MKTSLIKALAMQLQASAILADELYQQAREEETSELVGGLSGVLDKIFGNAHRKDSTEQKAEDTTVSVEVGKDYEAAPVIKAPIEIIYDMLNDERFKLRSFSSIKDKTGLDQDEVLELLDDNDVDYIVLTKRNGRDEVVGLSSRN